MKFELVPILKIDSYTTHDETVYDIEVEEDHSFCVDDNIIVHNSACTTRLKTGVGFPQLSAIIECSHAAHGLRAGKSRLGLICADGGCRTPSDVCKAFAAGADFVMLGGMLAGTEECEGEWEYEYRRAIVDNNGKTLQEWWQPIDPGYREPEKRKSL